MSGYIEVVLHDEGNPSSPYLGKVADYSIFCSAGCTVSPINAKAIGRSGNHPWELLYCRSTVYAWQTHTILHSNDH